VSNDLTTPTADNAITTNNPMHEMVQRKRENFSKKVSRMFGLSLDIWNNIMVFALGIAAVAAIIVGISTFVIIKMQKAEAIASEAAFDEYKFGVAAQVAEAKKEGIEAGKTAGNALVRAAELEKEAASARLETEKLKQVVAWRTLSPSEAAALESNLAAHPGSVNLRYTDGDPEALFLAIQISDILAKAKWHVAPGAVKLSNAIFFGYGLPDANGTDAQTLRAAFEAAKLPFSAGSIPQAAISFSISTIGNAPILMVGSRKPALP
jgi:hypothetical protein